MQAEILPPVGGVHFVGALHPLRSERTELAMAAGLSVAEMIRAAGADPVLLRAAHVYVDGSYIPRDFWDAVRPKPGRTVTVRVIPMGGGGGGGGGSKVLRTVLMIAVVAAAAWIGGGGLVAAGWAEAGGTFAAGGFGAAVGGAAVSMAGMLLVNALVPPPMPKSAALTAAEDVYGITGSQNAYNPYGTVPRVYGRKRVYPVKAAKDFAETIGNDQYLNVLFDFGYGPLALSDLRIGDTPLDRFKEVEIETRQGFPNDAPITLYRNQNDYFGVNVTLKQAEGWYAFTTPELVNEAYLDIQFPALVIIQSPSRSEPVRRASYSVTLRYEWRVPGGTWVTADHTVSDKTESPVRRTIRIVFPAAGQYEVRIRRVTGDDQYTSDGSQIVSSSALLAYRTVAYAAPVTAKGRCLVALRIKATNQINGTVSQFNAIAQSLLPTWNGSVWTPPVATRNPAWIYADILRGAANARPAADSRIDLAGLRQWAIACDAKVQDDADAFHFDGVMDQRTTVYQTLAEVAATGRAAIAIRDGKFGVVRDVPQTVPVQHFTPRNSWGFEATKVFADLPHAVKVRFPDETTDYQQNEIMVYADGYSAANATKFETLELRYCTRGGQAWREGRYHLAAARLRPETYTLNADIEHLVCTRGDLVAVAHDVPRWGGTWGRIRSVTLDGSSRATAVELDEPASMVAGISYGCRIRRADGSGITASVATQPGDRTSVAFTVPVNPPCEPGDLFLFGETDRVYAEMLVKAIEPGPDLTARLTLVDAAPAIHTAYAAPIPPFDSRITPDRTIQAPGPVRGLAVVEEIEFVNAFPVSSVLVSWQPPENAAVGGYEVYRRDLGGGWRLETVTQGTGWRITGVVTGETVAVAVVAASPLGRKLTPEEAPFASAYVAGKTTPPSDVGQFSATLQPFGITLRWQPVPDVDAAGYVIRLGPDWATATPLAEVQGNSYPWEFRTAGTYTLLIKATDTTGNESAAATPLVVTIAAPATPHPVFSFSGPDFLLSWPEVTGQFAIAEYEVREGAAWEGGSLVSVAKATGYRSKVAWGGFRRFWVAAIDVAGNVGIPASIDVLVERPGQVASLQPQVIDNNVLLRWTVPASGSLPVDHYLVRRGPAFDEATPVGQQGGTFATVFEDSAGAYLYWVAAVDTAGNVGEPRSVPAAVDQPPDYVLRADIPLALSDGTMVNALVAPEGNLILPVPAGETWQEHFASRDWFTPQGQVDAGYPVYIQPSLASGSWIEEIDYGTVLAGTRVSVSVASSVVAGAPTLSVTISTSPDGMVWTDHPDVTQVFATSFRHVRVRLDVAAPTPQSVLSITEIRVKLDAKLIADAGNGTASASDAGGTMVAFNRPFIDVRSITVTAGGTTPRIALYDFVDAPYPTQFRVLLFDTNGNRVDGPFSWTARGY